MWPYKQEQGTEPSDSIDNGHIRQVKIKIYTCDRVYFFRDS